jgi:hypothetical protein
MNNVANIVAAYATGEWGRGKIHRALGSESAWEGAAFEMLQPGDPSWFPYRRTLTRQAN